MNREPVAVGTALYAVFVAVMNLGEVFNWWLFDEAQRSALVAVYIAVAGVVAAVVRSRVTPIGRGAPGEGAQAWVGTAIGVLLIVLLVIVVLRLV